MSKTILLAGATGLVGSACLPLLLADERVGTVITLVRRPLDLQHAKLKQWTAPSDDLLKGLKPGPVEAVICCLGTTIKKAGSQVAFITVDKDLPLGIAHWAREQRVPTYCIISALGADPGSRIFYSRVKGEVEQELEAMHFSSLALFQPSILMGPRKEKRSAERIGIGVMKAIGPVLLGALKNYRVMPHDVLAKALVNTALSPEPGSHRYLYSGILRQAGA
ncbi:MAG: NAD-dependent dehydratase [Flavobacteriales bacterium]